MFPLHHHWDKIDPFLLHILAGGKKKRRMFEPKPEPSSESSWLKRWVWVPNARIQSCMGQLRIEHKNDGVLRPERRP